MNVEKPTSVDRGVRAFALVKKFRARSVLFLLSCVLVTSCASYNAALIEDSEDTIVFNEHSLSSSETSLQWSVFHDPELVKKYYSRDLLERGIVPVEMVVTNNAEDAMISLDPGLITITDENGSTFDTLPVSVAIDRARFSQGQTAAWTIGFGLIGAAISASNVSKANSALGEDFRLKALNSQLIQPNESARGTLFFSVDSSVTTLDGSVLEVPLTDSFGGQETALLPLSGLIKIGSPDEKNKNTDSRFTNDNDPLTPAAD